MQSEPEREEPKASGAEAEEERAAALSDPPEGEGRRASGERASAELAEDRHADDLDDRD